MNLRDFIPFQQDVKSSKKKVAQQVLPPEDQKKVTKLFKAASLAVGFEGMPRSLTSRTTFEQSPYSMEQITQAIDTDSYVRQAFSKYRELFWKEGFEIVSENPDAVAYLWQRIDFMEVAMKRPFQDFLASMVDQLIKYGNVFVVRAYGDLEKYFPGRLHIEEGRKPIVGYYIIPTEKVHIKRDKHNRPLWYKQSIDGNTYGATDDGPKWNAKEVIHLALDKKEGRAFGTPFIITAIDDVLSLRQIEEDIQNLIHKELFPLYKFQIGTEEMPAEPDELERAIDQIEHLRTEGAMVIPERYNIEAIGADGKALDASPYLEHFKQRVAVGLGLYPHHLGMTDGGNKAATDRLDTALYDRVKMIQRYVADAIRLYMFNELLIEGGFDPYVTPMEDGISDRCLFRYNEIDADSQIKKENHMLQKWTSDAMDKGEVRLGLNLPSDVDENELFTAVNSRLQPQETSPGPPLAKPGLKTSGPERGFSGDDRDSFVNNKGPARPGSSGKMDQTKRPDGSDPSTGGKANQKKTAFRSVSNKSKPANQHGRKLSPNIRHDDLDYLNDIIELLDEGDDLNG